MGVNILLGVIMVLIWLLFKGGLYHSIYNVEQYYGNSYKRDTSQWTWFAHLVLFILFIDIKIVIVIYKILEFIYIKLFIKQPKEEFAKSGQVKNIWDNY